MEHLLSEVKHRLGKPYADLEFLLQCLAEVMYENNRSDMADMIPWTTSKEEPEFNEENAERLLHLYSICFQLLNLSEVNGAVQNRRVQQEKGGLSIVSGLWGDVFCKLSEMGVTEEKLAGYLPQINAEAVLTAHPTEAKRPV